MNGNIMNQHKYNNHHNFVHYMQRMKYHMYNTYFLLNIHQNYMYLCMYLTINERVMEIYMSHIDHFNFHDTLHMKYHMFFIIYMYVILNYNNCLLYNLSSRLHHHYNKLDSLNHIICIFINDNYSNIRLHILNIHADLNTNMGNFQFDYNSNNQNQLRQSR